MTELTEYLTLDRVTILAGTTKAEAMAEMIDLMVASDGSIPREELTRGVWKREELMSTGLGNGLAIPHVRMPEITHAAMAVGVSRTGLGDYESLDKQPVHIIILIVAPAGQHETYIRLLAKVVDVLKEDPLRLAIIEADNPKRIHHILTSGTLE